MIWCENYKMNILDLNFFINKKICILWFWKEWFSSYNFLSKIWKYDISIHDINSISQFDDKYKKILINTKFIWWNNYLENLDNYDIIIKSPWISVFQNNLQKYTNKIISQTKIFFDLYKWKTIVITWTKWKSTISNLIYQTILNAWLKVKLVWNWWTPILDEIDFKDDFDFVVCELSSYQLELSKINPSICILTNLYFEHIDFHWNFENYKNAKLNSFWKNTTIFINSKFKYLVSWLNNKIFYYWTDWDYTTDWVYFFNKKNMLYSTNNIKLKWFHNLENICWVIWVWKQLWIDEKIINNTINNFEWLKHRLEIVTNKNWITFVDDAISTTPESTICAIETFWDNIWSIMLWWTDRWYDFVNLIKSLEKYNIKNLVLFKDSWLRIQTLLDDSYNYILCDDMKWAVEFAFKFTKHWKICLLSCASPSYSLWKNFEQKWDYFKKYILEF